MTNANNRYEETIADLVADIDERLRPIIEDQRMVNRLCEKVGLPLRYPEAETAGMGRTRSIRRDQFHKKPLATAVREYLTIRGRSDQGGLGAATVNEIFDALISGGYTPETDDEDNAKRGLRIALTKNSVTFYRVPGGPSGDTYGLLEWYPNAKPQTEDDAKPPRGKRRGRPPKNQKKRGRPPKATATEKTKEPENVIDLPQEKAARTEAA